MMECAEKRAAMLVFFAAFVYFLYCAVPTLYWGDSAEMASVACSMGVPHSPGYPLFSQLAALAGELPFESFPFRLNLMNVFLGALAVLLAFEIASVVSGSKIAGLAAAAGLIGCRAFVYNSLFIEVYQLHSVLLLGALYMLASHARNGDDRRLFAAALLVFAGAAHHLLMVFAFAGLIIYFILLPGHKWRVTAGPLLFLLGAAMIKLFRAFDSLPKATLITTWTLVGLGVVYIGYLIYLGIARKGLVRMLANALIVLLCLVLISILYSYLPFSSSRMPVADWWSPKSLGNFINLLLLKGYESTVPANKMDILRRFDLLGLAMQVPFMTAALILPGIIFIFRKHWRLAVFLIVVGFGTFCGSLFVRHGKPEALRIPVYITSYIFAGVGLTAVPSWRLLKGKQIWKTAIKTVAVLIAVGILALNLEDADHTFMNRSSAAYELGRGIIDGARSHSLLFIGEQTPSIMNYFKACEPGEIDRKELAVIPVSFIPFGWGLDQLRAEYPDVHFPAMEDEAQENPIFRADDPARASYAIDLINANPDRAVFSDFFFIPRDMRMITVPHGDIYQILPFNADVTSVLNMIKSDKSPVWRKFSTRDTTSAMNIASVHNERGKIYLDFGLDSGNEKYFRIALREFNTALKFFPAYADSMSNKGQTLMFFRQVNKGLKLMQDALKLAPDQPRLYETLATVKFRIQSPKSVREAIALWETAFALDPHNARALNNIASALVGMQQNDAALQFYSLAIKTDPGYLSSYINLARLYNKTNNCAKAIETLEIARDKRPDRLDIRSELAQQYSDCGMKRLYAQCMEEIIRDFPANEELFYTLAVIFRNVRQYDNLVRAMAELRRINPGFPVQQIFSSIESCDVALGAMKQVMARMPADPQMYLSLALRYSACGRDPEGLKVLEQAAVKFPKQRAFKMLIDRVKNPEAYPSKPFYQETPPPVSATTPAQ